MTSCVEKTLLGRLERYGKSKIAEPGRAPDFHRKKPATTFPFLPSTMLLKCSELMYVTYTYEIFPDPRRKKSRFSSSNIRDFFFLIMDFFGILCQASRSIPSFFLLHGYRKLAWGKGWSRILCSKTGMRK